MLQKKVFLFIFLLTGLNAIAQNHSHTYQKSLDTLFSNFSENLPGLSYAVIKDGKIIENKNIGLAEMHKNKKSGDHTNYRMASVTKQFTATAILMLVDQKKMDLHTSLTDIFMDFPDYGKAITIHQLLSHTSGLLDYENLMSADRKKPILDHEVLNLLKRQQRTKFPPGTKYDYSNSGYAVLSQIIEKISGQKFEKYMKKHIFKPLKMKNTLVYTARSNIKNRAFGYTLKDAVMHQTDQSMTSSVQGDGGVYTSISDYLKWNQALENNQLITPDLLQKAYTVQSKISESVWDYGYGWRIKFDGATKIVSHSGHTSGFTNYVVKIPDQKLAVVLFSNRRNEDSIIEIGDILLDKYAN